MINFELQLATALAEDAAPTGVMPAKTGTQGTGAPPVGPNTDPEVAKKVKEVERQSGAKSQVAQAGSNPNGTAPSSQVMAAGTDQQHADAERKRQQEAERLGTAINQVDADVLKAQAKITGGQAKQTDIDVLNQKLIAKKGFQDQIMRVFGVTAS